MLKRPLALLVFASTFSFAAGATRQASASACGEEYEYVAQNAHITLTPALSCVTATIDGSNQPGCGLLKIHLYNGCAEDIVIVDDETCDINTGLGDCTTVAPGQTGDIGVDAVQPGPLTEHFTFSHQGQSVDVTLQTDIVDIADHGACSVSAVGAGSDRQMWGWIAALGLVLPVLRRRRRARAA